MRIIESDFSLSENNHKALCQLSLRVPLKAGRGSLTENTRLLRSPRNDTREARDDKSSLVSNEKGIALVMVLILSVIALAIMAGLIYMITSGTQISGMQKRYETALEAGVGGSDIMYQLIGLRGIAQNTNSFLNEIDPSDHFEFRRQTPNACRGSDIYGVQYTGWEAKMRTSSSTWSPGCDRSLTIDPNIDTSYDWRFELGSRSEFLTFRSPTFRVYAKIVDTVEGNSAASDEGLVGKGVVASGGGEIEVKPIPYLYTMEIDAEREDNPSERAKLSILYQY